MCCSTCAESEIIVFSSIFVVVCCCFLSLYHRYRVLSSVCYMFFESFFCRVLSCLIPPWVGVVARAWVFVSMPPSFACAGLQCVVGVFVLGGVCSLVRGAAGGVGCFTLGWV